MRSQSKQVRFTSPGSKWPHDFTEKVFTGWCMLFCEHQPVYRWSIEIVNIKVWTCLKCLEINAKHYVISLGPVPILVSIWGKLCPKRWSHWHIAYIIHTCKQISWGKNMSHTFWQKRKIRLQLFNKLWKLGWQLKDWGVVRNSAGLKCQTSSKLHTQLQE